ncbi:NAD(P)-dependent oxidoreductase [Rhodoferax sediminis]|uniref:NAD(P)-dependent oxidoreductase n=1 Tax=Rhodoferax sediminis TaxID=2509614 RepID=A0A515DE29_9BURK|nr:NAD(P)-dependent oxidoreductase [Rhodoferax sediminis]QDL38655.1 NAD(P)-dependent oxidoreductase [Rhodoferax sediminis]
MNSQPREKTVGFVGLGSMGSPMAANLLKAGHLLVVYDIDKTKVDQTVSLGAQAGAGPADVARRASRMISMVDTTAQAEEVIVGPAGFIQTAQSGDLVISMSTIDPMALKRMHELLAAKGVALIDAPVSGMDKGAKEGTLKAFVGGDAAALERARSILKDMTAEITHIGGIGQGAAMKLINNMIFQVARITIAEALVVGAKAGIEPKQLFAVISKATGNSIAFQSAGSRMLSRDFVGSRLDSTFKDMELQTQLGKSLQVPMFMANIAQQVCELGRGAGLGSEDGAAIVKVYEQFAHITLGDGD